MYDVTLLHSTPTSAAAAFTKQNGNTCSFCVFLLCLYFEAEREHLCARADPCTHVQSVLVTTIWEIDITHLPAHQSKERQRDASPCQSNHRLVSGHAVSRPVSETGRTPEQSA